MADGVFLLVMMPVQTWMIDDDDGLFQGVISGDVLGACHLTGFFKAVDSKVEV